MNQDLKEKLDCPSDRNFSSVKERPKIVVREGSWLIFPLWYEYGWKEILEGRGITRADFKDIYEEVKFHFLRWSDNNERWETALDSLIEKVQKSIEIEENENPT